MENSTSGAEARASDRWARYVLDPPRSLRVVRYRGEDRAVALSAMAPADREGVRALYAALQSFQSEIVGAASDAPEVAAALAATFDVDGLLRQARFLGRDATADDVRQALHDVRGGALTSLLLELRRAQLRPNAGSLRALRVLTADHLKVMRNAVLELDDARRTEDLRPCEHSIERLAETISRVTGEGGRGSVRVAVQRSFVGAITMSCVELGALDRAALNIVNNAVRHAASDDVQVALLPVKPLPGADLCVCVANQVDADQARGLERRFEGDLARIFLEPFSTTGSGDGLKICVDFVSAAYGIVRHEDAVRSGLVDAKLECGWFIASMCWPAVA